MSQSLMDKAQYLADEEGYDDPFELARQTMWEASGPGICVNPDCDETMDSLEADGRCDCPSCGNEIQSICLILGVI